VTDAAHLREWLGALRSGSFPQATGALSKIVAIDNDGTHVYGYCCLGVGSKVAGVPAILREFEEDMDGEELVEQDDPAMEFGAAYQSELAPVEFVRWLGFEVAEDSESSSFDLVLDMPEEYLAYQGPRGTASNPTAYESSRTESYTLSELNDEGFTFTQIADLIDYFGLAGLK
jgi:hypothetical protein